MAPCYWQFANALFQPVVSQLHCIKCCVFLTCCHWQSATVTIYDKKKIVVVEHLSYSLALKRYQILRSNININQNIAISCTKWQFTSSGKNQTCVNQIKHINSWAYHKYNRIQCKLQNWWFQRSKIKVKGQ